MTALLEFLSTNREEIIGRCRTKVAARSDPPLLAAKIEHGVPVFLDQLVNVLSLGTESNPEIGRMALLHGRDLLVQGYSASEVVHNYGDVCQSITELAVEMDASISASDFRMLNKCLDDAIAGAVTEHGKDDESGVDGKSAAEGERSLADELRLLGKTALIAFDVIKSGRVGIAGSTGGVLHRTLKEICALSDRAIAEVPVGASKRKRA